MGLAIRERRRATASSSYLSHHRKVVRERSHPKKSWCSKCMGSPFYNGKDASEKSHQPKFQAEAVSLAQKDEVAVSMSSWVLFEAPSDEKPNSSRWICRVVEYPFCVIVTDFYITLFASIYRLSAPLPILLVYKTLYIVLYLRCKQYYPNIVVNRHLPIISSFDVKTPKQTPLDIFL